MGVLRDSVTKEESASAEKRRIALSSVIAAVFLTGAKLIIGFLTGSLGILSEAAHSGLDLIAAIITYFAVRTSDKPADREHLYGHEKVENLSALIETLLLLVTCIWISCEAIKRLFFHEVEVEATAWAFGVVIFSIIVDISRSRALMRVAKKYNSQALEADALHFSTDVWSSAVVLVGLALVWIGDQTGTEHILMKADPIAALGVACIVTFVSLKLGKRTVDALLDSAPEGLTEMIESVALETAGVKSCRNIRVRQSGSRTFVDLTVDVEKSLSVESGHLISQSVEQAILKVLPSADVVIRTGLSSHVDPDLPGLIRVRAETAGHKVHNIFVYEQGDRVSAELHLEVPGTDTLISAHGVTVELERTLREHLPGLEQVNIHIEPRREHQVQLHDITAASAPTEDLVKDTACRMPGILDCHAVEIRQSPEGLYISMHAVFPDQMKVEDVHSMLSKVESQLYRTLPGLRRILIHPEPVKLAGH